MSCTLTPARPDGALYRLGRRPDPWAWPDWSHASERGTFDNRFDDPRGEYRVLYASSQRSAPFLETLARFRPDPAIAAVQIEGDERDKDFPTVAAGTVPRTWLDQRVLGTALCAAEFADIGTAVSLAHLRDALAAEVLKHGLDELDAATIRLRAPRELTQAISRYVYECTREDGERAFQGIRYRSRLGDNLTNWAICEPADLEVLEDKELREDDPDLLGALEILGLRLV